MTRLIPPFLVGFLLLLMIPTTIAPVGRVLMQAPYNWSGILIVVLGIFFLMSGHRTFMRKGTEIHTFKMPSTLVTSGVFRFTRNPMYLGFLLILIGVAVSTNEALNLAYALMFFCAANFWYIPTEERNAMQVFGGDYRAYQARVRRWI